MDIDKLLQSDSINNIIELDNYICEICSWGENIDKLNKAQRDFYFNQTLEREVNNGGFYLYFLNSSGKFAHETVESLIAIGADKTAKKLQDAIDQLPGGTVPKDNAERQLLLLQISNELKAILNQLDQRFFSYDDNLNELNLDYVRKNKASFS